MATLTKVLVIIAAVLSLFLSALVISYSVNTDKILQDRDAEVSRSQAAQAVAADNANQAGVAKAAWEKERAGLTDQIKDRTAKAIESGLILFPMKVSISSN